jgi:hypothetical protein
MLYVGAASHVKDLYSKDKGQNITLSVLSIVSIDEVFTTPINETSVKL